MTKKPSSYCSLISYFTTINSDLLGIIKQRCLTRIFDYSKNRKGTTFIYPSKDMMKALEKSVVDNSIEADNKIKSLVIPKDIPTIKDFNDEMEPNGGPITLCNTIAEIDKVTSDTVKFKNGVVIKRDKDFTGDPGKGLNIYTATEGSKFFDEGPVPEIKKEREKKKGKGDDYGYGDDDIDGYGDDDIDGYGNVNGYGYGANNQRNMQQQGRYDPNYGYGPNNQRNMQQRGGCGQRNVQQQGRYDPNYGPNNQRNLQQQGYGERRKRNRTVRGRNESNAKEKRIAIFNSLLTRIVNDPTINPFVAAVASFGNYLKKNSNTEAGKKALMGFYFIISSCPESTMYFILEPYKTSAQYLFLTDHINKWWDESVEGTLIGDKKEGINVPYQKYQQFINESISILANPQDLYNKIENVRTMIDSKSDTMHDYINNILKVYKQLADNNTINGSKVYSNEFIISLITKAVPDLKLWMDEVRYRFSLMFNSFYSEMVNYNDGNVIAARINNIRAEIERKFRGDNYKLESLVANIEKQNLIQPTHIFLTNIYGFVHSKYLLFVPRDVETIMQSNQPVIGADEDDENIESDDEDEMGIFGGVERTTGSYHHQRGGVDPDESLEDEDQREARRMAQQTENKDLTRVEKGGNNPSLIQRILDTLGLSSAEGQQKMKNIASGIKNAAQNPEQGLDRISAMSGKVSELSQNVGNIAQESAGVVRTTKQMFRPGQNE